MYILLRLMEVLCTLQNPVWMQGISPLFSMYRSILCRTSDSVILPPMGKSDIGLHDAGFFAGFSFLRIGTIIASFQVDGKSPFVYISLIISRYRCSPPLPKSLNWSMKMLSCPGAFLLVLLMTLSNS